MGNFDTLAKSTDINTRHARVPIASDESVHVLEVSPADTNPRPAIVCLHGTGGPAYGERRWRLRFGRKAATAGFRVFVFDSRGTGYSDGSFEDWTVSRFLQDTLQVLAWVRQKSHVDESRVGLFGFSLGSAVAVLAADKHPDWIKTLIVYTLPIDMDRGFLWYFERFARGSLDSFYSTGRAWLPPMKEYLNRSFLDDLSNHDVRRSVSSLELPMLLVQPTLDDQVPRWVSRQAYDLKPGAKEWVEVTGTHTMYSESDGTGPSGWNEKQEKEVSDLSLAWFRDRL